MQRELMICEIKAANNRSGDYQPCDQEATRISRFGWCACEEHASIADLRFSDIKSMDDVKDRLIYRPNPIPEFHCEHFYEPGLGIVTFGST
jgi:hypothetical protein